MEDRIKRAVELFGEGYNCSQSVFAAFADLYDVDPKLAFRLSASFGGGIGRMRQTCGAACGMFMLAGLANGSTVGSDQKAKGENYKLVQTLAARFKERNGSLICSELLGLSTPAAPNPQPEGRTEEYYRKRPCVKMVEEAARIFAEWLEEENNNQ